GRAIHHLPPTAAIGATLHPAVPEGPRLVEHPHDVAMTDLGRVAGSSRLEHEARDLTGSDRHRCTDVAVVVVVEGDGGRKVEDEAVGAEHRVVRLHLHHVRLTAVVEPWRHADV